MLYESKLFASLEEEQTKLWHLSALAMFGLFNEEHQTGYLFSYLPLSG
jgi:hypothetical protein